MLSGYVKSTISRNENLLHKSETSAYYTSRNTTKRKRIHLISPIRIANLANTQQAADDSLEVVSKSIKYSIVEKPPPQQTIIKSSLIRFASPKYLTSSLGMEEISELREKPKKSVSRKTSKKRVLVRKNIMNQATFSNDSKGDITCSINYGNKFD